MKVLFCHEPKGNASEIFKALSRLEDFEVFYLSSEQRRSWSLFEKLMWYFRIPLDRLNYNSLLSDYDLSDFSFVIIIKGLELRPRVLNRIKLNYPKVKLVNLSLDDMSAKHNTSIYYDRALTIYDIIFTNKSYNVRELQVRGAQNVRFFNNKYSKEQHKIVIPDFMNVSGKVIFIGALEAARIRSILHLCNKGIVVHIFTDDIRMLNSFILPETLIVHPFGLYGKYYASAITNAAITLSFLRKMNRDVQTTRSVEIPACGGCMLAEHTAEHLSLFKENVEAIYFRNDEELFNKARYLLDNPDLIQTLKAKAFERTRRDNYSYDDLAIDLCNEVENMRAL